jgi:O-antigen/teichoic acid export membrane protein
LRIRPSGRHLTSSLRYSLPLLGIAICYALGTRIDRLVLEHHVALETLATYAVLAALLRLPAIVLDALDSTIRPHLYPGMRSGDHPDSMQQYQALYVCIGLLALSFAAFLGSQVSLVTQLDAYTGVPQWLPLGATALAPTILSRYYALQFEYHKQSVALSVLSLFRLLTRALLLVWWVPRLGIGGLLAALLVAEILNAIAFATIARRRLEASPLLPLVVAQFGFFAGITWLVAYAVPAERVTVAGVLQFVGVCLALVALNYRSLRQLARLPSLHASNLGKPTRSDQA